MLFTVLNPYFLELATQPLLEMTLLAVGTVSFWLAARRHSAGYVTTSLAALTRWDAFFLAPVYAVMRFVESGRQWRHLLYGAAVLVPPMAWLALSVAHSRQVNPYVEEMIDRADSTVFWALLRILFQMVVGHAPDGSDLSGAEIPLFVGVSVLFLIGLVRLWQRDRWITALLSSFLLTYFTVHGVFGIATYRYHVPILPLVLFVLFLAIEPTASATARSTTPRWLIAGWIGLAGLVAWTASGWPQALHVRWVWVFAALYIAVFALFSAVGRSWPRWASGGVAVAALVCVWPQLVGWDHAYQRQKWAFSETVAAVRWVERYVPAGERVVMAEPWLAAARVAWDGVRDRVISIADFSWENGLNFAHQCRDRNVRYVIWLSTYQDHVRTDYWHARMAACYLNELGFGSSIDPDGFQLVTRLFTGGGHEARVYRINEGPVEEDIAVDLDRDWGWRPYLVSGWSQAPDGAVGRRHIWAVGRQAVIRFSIDAPAAGGELILAGFPFQPPGAPVQVMQVAVNGRSLGRFAMADRLEEYRLTVPGNQLAAGDNRFTLEFSFSRSPQSAGVGEDVRSLAAGFKRIAYIPADQSAAPAGVNTRPR